MFVSCSPFEVILLPSCCFLQDQAHLLPNHFLILLLAKSGRVCVCQHSGLTVTLFVHSISSAFLRKCITIVQSNLQYINGNRQDPKQWPLVMHNGYFLFREEKNHYKTSKWWSFCLGFSQLQVLGYNCISSFMKLYQTGTLFLPRNIKGPLALPRGQPYLFTSSKVYKNSLKMLEIWLEFILMSQIEATQQKIQKAKQSRSCSLSIFPFLCFFLSLFSV